MTRERPTGRITEGTARLGETLVPMAVLRRWCPEKPNSQKQQQKP